MVLPAVITVDAPPPVPRSDGAGPLARLVMPAVTLLAGVGMVAAVVVSGGAGSGGVAPHNPMFLMFPIVMVGSAIATAVQAGGGRRRAAELDADRSRYLTYLRSLGGRLSGAARTQQDSLYRCHPAPVALWALAGGPRMWERRRGGADFCRVRIGVGPVPAATMPIGPEVEPGDEADPVTWTALHRFVRAHSTVSAPATVALLGVSAVTIEGDIADARALVRAMVCQLAVSHSPADLMVVAVAGTSRLDHWDWLKWLPHHHHCVDRDEGGGLRMVYPTLKAALAARYDDRQVIVVADGVVAEVVTEPDAECIAERIAETEGVTVLEIGTAGTSVARRSGLRLRLTPTQLIASDPEDTKIVAVPDLMPAADALICARRIAECRADADDGGPGAADWPDLIGLPALTRAGSTVHWDSLWDSVGVNRLRVPIGITPTGDALDLDIKEAAERGMGPHGLCVGATGSGKSELLRTIALGMIARHSPEALNLVLVDFKGGATFLGLERARHVSAVITNLAEEAHLVDRMRDALTGEINRRQQLLRSSGNLASVTEYERARRTGRPLAPLPVLFVIVDEFSELLCQQPEFVDVFVAIGRLGRSLGIHLLLASQRLDEGRLRGLDSHLSYRICLKTLSANESRLTIGVADAYELPGTPGAAYLKVGAAEPLRFQAAFVSGRVDAVPAATPRGAGTAVPMVFTAAPMGSVVRPGQLSDQPTARRTLVDTVLDSLAGAGPPARQIWLPPLAESPTLDAVLADCRPVGDLTVPIGLADRSFDQRRSALVVDLSGAAGNVAVVGAPQSGKSTLLRTVLTALALGHDPGRVALYCLDFGGGGLASLTEWPPVGAVAGRHDVDLVRRTVAEVAAVLRGRQCGDPAGLDAFGDVFLVVDGWQAMRQAFDALEPVITSIAAEGLSYGVHVVLTASRWADIRPALKDQIGTRIELRLGDPADSEIDRKRAANVAQGRPGHGLTPDGLPFLAALPRVDGIAGADGLDAAAAEVGELLRARHGHRRAPVIRLLPEQVDYDGLVTDVADPPERAFVLGVDENRLSPVTLDFRREPHLLILGAAQSGKTATIRVLCREILRTAPPAGVQLYLVDPRRGMLGEIDADRLAGYLATPVAVTTQLPALVATLTARLPGAEVTQRQLRTRSWWTGPDVYLVVDDYDLVATAAGNPLTPILAILPHASDVGLHVVVARRSGGAARALYEPVLAAIRDLGAMGLQLSASPDEGPLLGTARPRLLPPGRGSLITRDGGEQVVQVAWSVPR
jgi:DNA segregation ATPase FtsK/SpoIIIE, S-DNA-T family